MLVDSHCHLAGDEFAADLSEVVGRARAAGLTRALCILSADEPAELARAAAVAEAWPDVEFAAAIHPHRAGPYAGRVADAVRETRAAAERVGAVAFGEVGLDYHYDFAPRSVQRDVFAAQAALARERNRPIVIHTREAFDDTLAVVREAGAGLRGVLHCFSGSLDDARRAVNAGLYLSLSGIVTFPKAAALRDVAAYVPDDRLLIETDAPFLAPVPHRGKRNEPAWVAATARVVADARRIDLRALSALVTANYEAFVR
jgi:TatD DNase family protein